MEEHCQDHITRYDKAPKGWRFDRTWGSAVHGYVPICDGVPLILGGKKGLLRLTPEIADQRKEWRLSGYDKRVGTFS